MEVEFCDNVRQNFALQFPNASNKREFNSQSFLISIQITEHTRMFSSAKEIFMGKQAKNPKCMESHSIQNYSKDILFVSKK
jgi:hypothetical protein